MIFFYIFYLYYILTTIDATIDSNMCILIGCSCYFGINQTLITVLCKKQSFTEIPTRFPSIPHNTNLINLIDISDNQIESIPDGSFDGFKLEILDLSTNQINSLFDNSFYNVNDLKQLNLASNNLQEINSYAFNPLKHSLSELFLNLNKLSSSDNTIAAFSRLHHLEHLDISNNELEILPKINHLHKLKILFIKDNLIEEMFAECFPSSIVELALAGNRIKGIEETWFVNLKNIKILDLSRNQISFIDKNSFKNLQNLKTLILNKNDLHDIPSSSLVKLVHLTHLDLSFQNQAIVKIKNYAFDRENAEVKYENIILTGNQIEEISNLAFCSALNSTNRHIEIEKNLELKRNKLFNTNPCILKQLNSKKNPNNQIFISLDTLYLGNNTNYSISVPAIDCYSCDPINYLESYKIYLRLQVNCLDSSNNDENKIVPTVCDQIKNKDICVHFKQFDCYLHDSKNIKSSNIKSRSLKSNTTSISLILIIIFILLLFY
jgi:hypothetical protein